MRAEVDGRSKNKGQFKKGQSGNPAGRPAGALNRHNLIVKRMTEEAVVRLGEAAQKKRPTLRDMEPGVAWLMTVGEKDPVALLNMLKHITPAAPKQVDVNVTMAAEQLVETMTKRRQELAGRKAQVLDADFEDVTDERD